MKAVLINGREFKPKNSPYNPQNSIGYYTDKIRKALASIGITAQYVDINYGGGMGTRSNSYAEVTWHVNGKEYSFRSEAQQSDVGNIAAISQVIEVDCRAIRRGIKDYFATMRQYDALPDHTEGPQKRHWSQVFGVDPSVKDFGYLRYKYKQLSKERHPDLGGSEESMQELLAAWKEIQEEFEA